MNNYLSQNWNCGSFIQKMQIRALLRSLSKLLVMFAMLGLLYSCGGGSTGTDDDDNAYNNNTSNDDANGNDNDDEDKNVAVIKPIEEEEEEALGEFSFDAINYSVVVGGKVDVTINLTGEAPKTAFSVTLQEQINGIGVPHTLLNFSAGQTTYTYSYDAIGLAADSIAKLGFRDLPEGYIRASAKPVTIIVDPKEIKFSAPSYSVQAGKQVEIELQASKASQANMIIPVKIFDDAANSIIVETATILAGQTTAKLTYLAASSRADGTVIEYVITAVPEGFGLGNPSSTQVTITADPNKPDIVANFAKASYSVLSGQQSDIAVQLSSSIALTGTITLPYEYKSNDSASWTSAPVIFEPAIGQSQTPDTATFIYSAVGMPSGSGGTFRMTQAALNAVTVTSGGNNYKVSLGNPATASLVVTGQNLGFQDATLIVDHGMDADIIVALEDKASTFINVPLIINSTKSDGSAQTENVLLPFEAGEQQNTYSYATSDRLAGSNVTFSFGDLSALGYLVIAGKETSIVTLNSDQVSFNSNTPVTIDVAYNTSYDIGFTLSKARVNSSQIPLLITIDKTDGTTTTNKDSVTFPASQTAVNYSFFASSYNYSVGDKIDIAIDTDNLGNTGLTIGSDATSRKVTVIGNNTVEFVNSNYDITLGQAVSVPIQLQQPAKAALILSVKREFKDTNNNIIASESGTESIAFVAGQTKPSVEISYDSALVTMLGSVTYSFINVPDEIGVAVGKETSIVTLTDTRLNFDATTYDVRAGDSVDVKILISTALTNDSTIRLIKTKTVPGVTPVVSKENIDVVLLANQSSVIFAYDASSDIADSTIQYEIDGNNLPADAVLGGDDSTVITVKADALKFAEPTYTVRAGDSVDVIITLTAEPGLIYPLTIPLEVVSEGDPNKYAAGNVVFNAITETQKTFSYTAPAITGAETLSFGTLPVGLIGGDTAQINVTNSNISFDASAYSVRSGGDTVDVKVNLASPAIGALNIPLNVVASDGSTPAPNNIAFADGESVKIFTYSGNSSAGTTITYSFGTLPAGVTAAAGAQTVISVLDGSVNFELSSYNVRGGATIAIKVELASPANTALTIPINTAGATSATSNVDFAVGESVKTFNYVADTNAGSYVLSFGTLPVGVVAGGFATVNITDSAVTFDAPTYSVRGGASVDILVNLATAPIAGESFTIPLEVSPDVASSGSVTFNAGDTQVLFTYNAGLVTGTQTISFAALPAGVTAGVASVITITDSAIDFDASTYTVRAGNNLDITVTLASPATSALTIPLNATLNGVTSYIGDVSYAVGDTQDIFSYNAPAIAGNYTISFGTLPAGVSAGNPSLVTVTDSSVNFEYPTYTVRAGDVVSVKVKLASTASYALNIPLSVTAGTASPSNVTFAAGQTEATFAYTAPATAGTQTLRFGTLPVGVTDGGSSQVTVTNSGVSFDSASYTVRSGNNVDIKILLASPAIVTDPAVPLSIPLDVAYAGGTPVSAGNVTFADGVTMATFNYTAPATAGLYSFIFGALPAGVTAGAGAQQSDVTVEDSGIKFDSGAYTVRAGDTIDVTVKLLSASAAAVTIPINTPGGANANENVIFNVGDTQKTFSYAPSTQGNYTLNFGVLPAGVTLDGSIDQTIITVENSGIEFDAPTYTVRAGDNAAITVTLASAATSALTVALNTTFNGVTSYIGDVTYAVGDSQDIFSYTAPATLGDYTLSFGTLPAGVTAGSDAIISVTDSGIEFDSATYTVRAGDTINVTLQLASAAVNTLSIPVNVTGGVANPSNVSIAAGQTTATFIYTAPTTAGTETISFAALPAGVIAGSSSQVNVQDSGISFDSTAYDVRSGNNVGIKLVLASPAIVADPAVPLSIPLNVAYAGGTPVSAGNVTFADGVTIGTFNYTAPATAGLYSFTFGTLPAGVTAGAGAQQSDVTVSDSGLKFDSSSYTARVGETLNIKVVLTSGAVTTAIIPINVTPTGGSLISAGSVTFNAGDTEKSLSYTAPATTGDYTFSFGTLPASVVLDGSIDETVLSVIDNGIQFDASTYSVRAGDSISIKVELTSPAITALSIPVNTVGAVNASTNVSFAIGESAKLFSYVAGTNLGAQTLSFGTLPAGVSKAGVIDETIVTIIDSGIEFGASTYTVRAGDSINVTVNLANAPDVGIAYVIPINTAGGANATESVIFSSGETQKTFLYTPATAGTYTLDFGTLPAGVTKGATDETIVTVTDSSIEFDASTYTVRAGGTINVTVNLATAPDVGIAYQIPINIAGGANATENVIFSSGETQKTFSYTPATTGTYTLDFGTLPAGVIKGATDETVVTVTDSAIDFEQATYTVRAGDTVSINVELVSPATSALSIPLIVSAGSVSALSFAIGDTQAIVTYSAPASDGTQTIGFGTLPADVTAGANSNPTITVTDSAIDFEQATYTVRAGDTISINIDLASAATSALTIPLTVDDGTGAVAAGNISYAVGATQATFSYSAPATAGTYILGFGTLPAGVTAGVIANSTITVTDSAIDFELTTQTVAFNDTVDIKAILASPATSALTIPLTVTAGSASVLSFADGDSEATVTYSAPAIAGVQTIGFGATLPAGVTAGVTDETLVDVGNIVDFASTSYAANAGDTVTVTLNLISPAASNVTIPLTSVVSDAILSDGPSDVTFNAGDASTTFDYVAAAVTTDQQITFGLGTLPANIVLGTNTDAVLTVTPYTIAFKDASYGAIYVQQSQEIALTVDSAFAVDTTLPLIRKITSLDENTTYATDNVTASFVAGATEGSVNAGAVNATTAPNQKDRKVIFSFDTSHANWSVNAVADADNAESQYIVEGYQYYFPDEPGDLFDYEILNLPTGSTIEVPFMLVEPLPYKMSFTFRFRNTVEAEGGALWSVWKDITLNNYGVVGQTQQSFSYKLPVTTESTMSVDFQLTDTNSLVVYALPGTDTTYGYYIHHPAAKEVSFSNATYADGYIGEVKNIALSASSAFSSTTQVPVVREIYSTTDGTNIDALLSTTQLNAVFNAGSTSATIADAPAYQKDVLVKYSLNTSSANWPVGAASDDDATLSSQYYMRPYMYEFADEVPGNGSGYHHLYVPNASTIEVPFTLNVPLKAKTNFSFIIRHDGGNWSNPVKLNLTNHGVVGQTQQSFLYTLPDSDLSPSDVFDDYYGLRFRLVAKDAVTLNPSKSFDQNIYEYRIHVESKPVIVFDTQSYERYVGESGNIQVGLSTGGHIFNQATTMLVKKQVTSTDGNIIYPGGATYLATFPAGSSQASFTDNNVGYIEDRKIRYTLSSSMLSQFQLDDNKYYTDVHMRDYRISFPDEPHNGGVQQSVWGNALTGGSIGFRIQLDAPLKVATAFTVEVTSYQSGVAVVSNYTFPASQSDVGSTTQNLTYTYPAGTNGRYYVYFNFIETAGFKRLYAEDHDHSTYIMRIRNY